jgi:SAM-dependent methyltransferase
VAGWRRFGSLGGMSEESSAGPAALSFGAVADAYDRARPTYPTDAAAWLVGTGRTVLELGAGTGKLTEALAPLAGRLLATDPLPPMLRHLVRRVPSVPVAVAAAERIPLPSRSVDVVVAGQAFHWFDLDTALPEIARVLRPGGEVALVWNLRDERIPWVRRLSAALGGPEPPSDPMQGLLGSGLFGFVDTARFRSWHRLDGDGLRDLVRSRSYIAVLPQVEQDAVLARVDALYEEYGRGAHGMRLPYVTHCYKAVVRPLPEPDPRPEPPEDDGLLIDFG